jgi:hypothetical protein
MKMELRVPKRQHIEFSRRGITEKKKYTTFTKRRKFEIKICSFFLSEYYHCTLQHSEGHTISFYITIFTNRMMMMMMTWHER